MSDAYRFDFIHEPEQLVRKCERLLRTAIAFPHCTVGGLRQRLVIVHHAVANLVKHADEGQRVLVPNAIGRHLQRDQRNGAIEQRNDITEAGGNIFGDNDGRMLVLRIELSLMVPIFDGADDVAFVGGAELDFDFVAFESFGVLQQEIEPSGAELTPFLILEDQVAKAKNRRVIRDLLLHPSLSEFAQADRLQFHLIRVPSDNWFASAGASVRPPCREGGRRQGRHHSWGKSRNRALAVCVIAGLAKTHSAIPADGQQSVSRETAA